MTVEELRSRLKEYGDDVLVLVEGDANSLLEVADVTPVEDPKGETRCVVLWVDE